MACGIPRYVDMNVLLASLANERDLAIGDFALKLDASYLANLFQYMPYKGEYPLSNYIPKIKSPPYIISEPSVRYIDLQPFWDRGCHLFLYTDGVDNLVDGYFVFSPEQHRLADPVEVVAGLLAEDIDPKIEHILGHKVVSRWSGSENNRALDVLGNLLGGANVERLEMATDLDLMNKAGWPFYIDDTSIIVWPIKDL